MRPAQQGLLFIVVCLWRVDCDLSVSLACDGVCEFGYCLGHEFRLLSVTRSKSF